LASNSIIGLVGSNAVVGIVGRAFGTFGYNCENLDRIIIVIRVVNEGFLHEGVVIVVGVGVDNDYFWLECVHFVGVVVRVNNNDFVRAFGIAIIKYANAPTKQLHHTCNVSTVSSMNAHN
jgi:hypothetical protein